MSLIRRLLFDFASYTWTYCSYKRKYFLFFNIDRFLLLCSRLLCLQIIINISGVKVTKLFRYSFISYIFMNIYHVLGNAVGVGGGMMLNKWTRRAITLPLLILYSFIFLVNLKVSVQIVWGRTKIEEDKMMKGFFNPFCFVLGWIQMCSILYIQYLKSYHDCYSKSWPSYITLCFIIKD